jgi:threonine aldolase
MTQEPQFASDNWSGLCPEALEYLIRANAGSSPAYGHDHWTARAADGIRELFEHDAEVFFAFNGTAANSMALAHLCQPYQAVVCHAWSHIETDECGAPGFFAHGARLLLGQGENGKLTPDSARRLARHDGDIRFPRPAVLSLTQSTEVGTVYTPAELSALSELAQEHHMKVHVDGARLMNAVAALGASPADLSWRSGVDVLSLGASKTGGGIGDTVVFFDRELAQGFDFRCKQSGQLAAKMRLLTAPLLGLMETGAWLRNARHANACAATLAEELSRTGIDPAFPVQANAVFVPLSTTAAEALRQRGWPFHISHCHGAARFMCGWDTTAAQIDRLIADIRDSVGPDIQ